jgi:hypothetical protein
MARGSIVQEIHEVLLCLTVGPLMDGARERLLRKDCRSLHCAPPDFLSRLVALMICMRLSSVPAPRLLMPSKIREWSQCPLSTAMILMFDIG